MCLDFLCEEKCGCSLLLAISSCDAGEQGSVPLGTQHAHWINAVCWALLCSPAWGQLAQLSCPQWGFTWSFPKPGSASALPAWSGAWPIWALEVADVAWENVCWHSFLDLDWQWTVLSPFQFINTYLLLINIYGIILSFVAVPFPAWDPRVLLVCDKLLPLAFPRGDTVFAWHTWKQLHKVWSDQEGSQETIRCYELSCEVWKFDSVDDGEIGQVATVYSSQWINFLIFYTSPGMWTGE